ncbi:ligase-associated DNA damage response endonuclease PdeM [Lysobacter sp. A3-1-A15]|uniref:ligase-associated DNA damage response endonuclease PdeM n=1 Tax=Novilysobacter viscosus TaxID=3098602 RepID=UPI002ED97BB6
MAGDPGPAATLDLAIAGESMRLYGERALYWPKRERLLIADLHLGKGDVFRRAGISLPAGGTSDDLGRLDRLLEVSGARELWMLGDVLHGPVNDTAWQRTWRDWRARHVGLRVAALVGNHDRALARAGLGLELLGEAVDDGPFALRHAPQDHPSLHVLCGHLHPCVSLPGMRRRWPVFWLRPGLTMLPAFSAFTGGALIERRAGEAMAICVQGQLMLLRGHAPVQGARPDV